ncbi:MAG TPA: hypothetical protein VFG42_13905 [Baekduia sp.]|uniref:hypothetical protein n=1 Tax=Baekduia sp. TaxID=2600305 RepID=UPI002D780F80|nr:hypothetical protein [Baekduia sp.]HET6507879.1 hypothetical protein [Baekduia sp.]
MPAGTYITFGFLWYFSAKEKLLDQNGHMPAGLAKELKGSFLASVPGLNAAWLLLGIMEAIGFVLVAAGLLAGEFLPARRKPLLLTGLGWSIFTFAAMAAANDVVGDFSTVAELFTSFTGTVLVIALVLLMPPYRERHWLTRFTDR